MSKEQQVTSNTLNEKEIIRVVKEASLTCYGVSGFYFDPKKGNEEEAIEVNFDKEGTFSLDLHVIVMENVKVTETIRSLQKTVRFYMKRLYKDQCKKVNIYAEGISSNK